MSKPKQSKQKDAKAKVPNAFQINPGMMQALDQVTPGNFPQFMFGNPQMVPENFKKAYYKNFKSFFTLIGINTVGGIAINMIITRVVPSILILPRYYRLPLRLLIFAAPFIATYNKLDHYKETNDDMLEEQYIKLRKFRKTGNIQEYFK